MSKKEKDEKPVEVFSEEEFEEKDLSKAELKKKKKEEKQKAKMEKKEQADYENDVLNDNPSTKAGRTFKMYKFIIKIIVCAILLAFAILMIVKQDEMIGVVYMVFGIVILFSAIMRMIPLLKSSTHHRSRLVLLVQVLIHLVLGIYLVVAAFYHWNILDKIRENNVQAATLEEQLNKVTGGWFAKFNISAFTYILVIYLFTFAIAYYWVTILYQENTKKSMFWLNTAACTLAVLLAIFAHWLTASVLVWVVIAMAIVGACVIGGEAGGGYYRYRKLVAHPTKEKEAEKGDEIEAPSRDGDKDYSDVDPNVIPQEEPHDDANIVS